MGLIKNYLGIVETKWKQNEQPPLAQSSMNEWVEGRFWLKSGSRAYVHSKDFA